MNIFNKILEKLEAIEYNQVILYKRLAELEASVNKSELERSDNVYFAGELFQASDKAQTDFALFLERCDEIDRISNT